MNDEDRKALRKELHIVVETVLRSNGFQAPVSEQDCLNRSGQILKVAKETKGMVMEHVSQHTGKEKAWASLARWIFPILMTLMALAGGAWALASEKGGIDEEELARAIVRAQQAQADPWVSPVP